MAKEVSLMTQRRETTLDHESQIVERARHDADAFVILYRRYLQPVYRYLVTRTGDPVEAEDLASQVFMDALEGLVHYHNRGNFAAWVFTIARRRLVDFYRKKRRDISWEGAALAEDQEYAVEKQLAIESDLLDRVEQKETLAQIRQLVEALPEDRQEILRLRYAAGLSYEEMASVLQRSPASIKMAMHRLLEQLQQSWEAGEAGKQDLLDDLKGATHE